MNYLRDSDTRSESFLIFDWGSQSIAQSNFQRSSPFGERREANQTDFTSSSGFPKTFWKFSDPSTKEPLANLSLKIRGGKTAKVLKRGGGDGATRRCLRKNFFKISCCLWFAFDSARKCHGIMDTTDVDALANPQLRRFPRFGPCHPRSVRLKPAE